MALDEKSKTFVVHVASLNLAPRIHPNREAQIASLPTEEVKILDKYSDFTNVFSEEKALVLPERTELNEHAIDLEDGKQPPYGPIYSLGPVELETLKTYIKTHLKTGFIRPSKSPASAPILFDKKTNGSFRLCVDYWGLNNLTIKNRYPLPLIEESFDRLGQAKRFTQLDLTNTYYQMRIKESDKWKTTFQIRYGPFKYQVIPFGLSNTLASFQGYINKILAGKLNIFVIVYLDDILIYTQDQSQGHMEAMQWVLEILRNNSLFANLKRCWFHKDEVRFLRYVDSSQGIRIEDERIEVVRNWPEPKSVRDIQVFIGFANFYQRFIRGFSRIVTPLTSMLKMTGSLDLAKRDNDNEVVGGGSDKNLSKSKKSKNTKFGIQTRIRATGEPTFLTPGAREAFNQLKQAFTEALILRHFDLECHIRIETDASGYAIGRVLSQITFD